MDGPANRLPDPPLADLTPADPVQADLILASGSPRRRELLSGLGVDFRVLTPDIAEVSAHTHPADIARDLAEQKARAVRAMPGAAQALILASDTLVSLGGLVLGKPTDAAQNAEYLRQLSGRTHTVYSGVALFGLQGLSTDVEATAVTFRALSEAEVQHYARSGEGQDKAGGYGIQGLGMALVARIEGDYSGVVGFPLGVVIRLLRGAGVAVWGQA